MNTNNWMGVYNDLGGGMFAGTYAPPESKGIRLHTTWDSEWPPADNVNRNAGITLCPYPTTSGGAHFWDDDWYRQENILMHVNTPTEKNKYANPFSKMHATVVDFGIVPPGE